MAYTYIDVESPYENIAMQACYNEQNELRVYKLWAIDGYVMHVKVYDEAVYDEMTFEETGEILLGYTGSWSQVPYNYNFEANPLEIYAVLESSVPADRIFGGGENNDHEVM